MAQVRTVAVDSLQPGDRLGQDIMAGSQVLLRRGTLLSAPQIQRILRLPLIDVRLEDATLSAASPATLMAPAALPLQATPGRSRRPVVPVQDMPRLSQLTSDAPTWMSSEHFARPVPPPAEISAEENMFAARKQAIRSEAGLAPLISPELDKSLSKALQACFINSAMKNRIDLARLEEVSETLRRCLKASPGGYIEFTDIPHYGAGLAARSLLSAKLFGQLNGLGNDEMGEFLSGQLAFSNAFCVMPSRFTRRIEELNGAEKVELGRSLKEFHDWLRARHFAAEERLETLLLQYERYDGSGIPYGLSADEIPALSQRWAITWRYSSSVYSDPGQKRVSPREAADELIQNSGRGFASSEVNNFIRKIGMFPRGSLVLLSDERLAVVCGQNERALLKPLVSTLSESGKLVGSLDLSREPGLYIRKQVLEY